MSSSSYPVLARGQCIDPRGMRKFRETAECLLEDGRCSGPLAERSERVHLPFGRELIAAFGPGAAGYPVSSRQLSSILTGCDLPRAFTALLLL